MLLGCGGFAPNAQTVAQAPTEGTEPPVSAKVFSIGAKVVEPYNALSKTTTTPIDTATQTNLLVFVAQQEVGAGTLVDNKGNTFTYAGGGTAAALTDSYADEYHVFYSLGAAGGTGHIFEYDVVNGFSTVFVLEVSADAPIQFGQILSSNILQSGTNVDIGSITSVGTSSFLIGFGASGEPTSSVTFDWLHGFSKQLEMGDLSYWQGSVATKTVAAGIHPVAVDVNEVVNGLGFVIELR